jgi:hypothetical protein
MGDVSGGFTNCKMISGMDQQFPGWACQCNTSCSHARKRVVAALLRHQMSTVVWSVPLQ